ncbi:MAG: DUF2203 family protein [Euryarchaeota archaeon]|nr:DUF2203 family protein [Euryarchaeota archaeon]MBT4924475.1 DUF2203 family protein [Euryarchaeota archaeon]MBT5736228.1 DUF2203 family protein [Euryarchaeota archaeon]MBT7459468.1 DUF2203 family protein [Euryarchaeota archaeon]
MADESNSPIFSGRPMEIGMLENREEREQVLPHKAHLVTIEQARESLPEARQLLIELQVMNDYAHDLTEEIEILLEDLEPEDEHVIEVADALATTIRNWQVISSNLSLTGARVASLDPGRLEWYGVVDGEIALYSWCFGEEDIEWYHHTDTTYLTRKPLIEA